VICKLSIVIPGGEHAGAIIDTAHIPVPGELLRLGRVTVEVLEVRELLPPRGDFHFLHATARVVHPDTAALARS
jgi:hypothetical protein